MRLRIIILFFCLNTPVLMALEVDPAKNGATEILKRALSVLPEGTKRNKVNLAFLSDEVKGQQASQQIYEMLESGRFKGVLAIGGNNPAVTDKLMRSITKYLSADLSGVTLVIAGLDTTEKHVGEKLTKLGAKLYFLKSE